MDNGPKQKIKNSNQREAKGTDTKNYTSSKNWCVEMEGGTKCEFVPRKCGEYIETDKGRRQRKKRGGQSEKSKRQRMMPGWRTCSWFCDENVGTAVSGSGNCGISSVCTLGFSPQFNQ